MKAKPCTIIFNGPKDGHIFAPIECESINKALKLAEEWAFPFRIYDMKGNFIRRGWRN